MRKIALVLIVFALGFASCKKEAQPLTRAQIQYKVDSITNARASELDVAAQRDLELRMTIEVKAKADSIVNAKLHPVKHDSTNPPVVLRPIPVRQGLNKR